MSNIKDPSGERYIGSVKLGPKGQIVIPKEVREMFGIRPGDTLLLLADKKRGIALERSSVFAKIADAIFAGHAKQVYPELDETDSAAFAGAIRQAMEGDADDGDSDN